MTIKTFKESPKFVQHSTIFQNPTFSLKTLRIFSVYTFKRLSKKNYLLQGQGGAGGHRVHSEQQDRQAGGGEDGLPEEDHRGNYCFRFKRKI